MEGVGNIEDGRDPAVDLAVVVAVAVVVDVADLVTVARGLGWGFEIVSIVVGIDCGRNAAIAPETKRSFVKL